MTDNENDCSVQVPTFIPRRRKSAPASICDIYYVLVSKILRMQGETTCENILRDRGCLDDSNLYL